MNKELYVTENRRQTRAAKQSMNRMNNTNRKAQSDHLLINKMTEELKQHNDELKKNNDELKKHADELKMQLKGTESSLNKSKRGLKTAAAGIGIMGGSSIASGVIDKKIKKLEDLKSNTKKLGNKDTIAEIDKRIAKLQKARKAATLGKTVGAAVSAGGIVTGLKKESVEDIAIRRLHVFEAFESGVINEEEKQDLLGMLQYE